MRDRVFTPLPKSLTDVSPKVLVAYLIAKTKSSSKTFAKYYNHNAKCEDHSGEVDMMRIVASHWKEVQQFQDSGLHVKKFLSNYGPSGVIIKKSLLPESMHPLVSSSCSDWCMMFLDKKCHDYLLPRELFCWCNALFNCWLNLTSILWEVLKLDNHHIKIIHMHLPSICHYNLNACICFIYNDNLVGLTWEVIAWKMETNEFSTKIYNLES